jgi:hypothetical protein
MSATESAAVELKCTVCVRDLSLGLFSVREHSVLPDLAVCKQCLAKLPKAEDAPSDDICSWCGQDGCDIYLCDSVQCGRGFCGTCITLWLGEAAEQAVKDSDHFQCYACCEAPLQQLQTLYRNFRAQPPVLYSILHAGESADVDDDAAGADSADSQSPDGELRHELRRRLPVLLNQALRRAPSVSEALTAVSQARDAVLADICSAAAGNAAAVVTASAQAVWAAQFTKQSNLVEAFVVVMTAQLDAQSALDDEARWEALADDVRAELLQRNSCDSAADIETAVADDVEAQRIVWQTQQDRAVEAVERLTQLLDEAGVDTPVLEWFHTLAESAAAAAVAVAEDVDDGETPGEDSVAAALADLKLGLGSTSTADTTAGAAAGAGGGSSSTAAAAASGAFEADDDVISDEEDDMAPPPNSRAADMEVAARDLQRVEDLCTRVADGKSKLSLRPSDPNTVRAVLLYLQSTRSSSTNSSSSSTAVANADEAALATAVAQHFQNRGDVRGLTDALLSSWGLADAAVRRRLVSMLRNLAIAARRAAPEQQILPGLLRAVQYEQSLAATAAAAAGAGADGAVPSSEVDAAAAHAAALARARTLTVAVRSKDDLRVVAEVAALLQRERSATAAAIAAARKYGAAVSSDEEQQESEDEEDAADDSQPSGSSMLAQQQQQQQRSAAVVEDLGGSGPRGYERGVKRQAAQAPRDEAEAQGHREQYAEAVRCEDAQRQAAVAAAGGSGGADGPAAALRFKQCDEAADAFKDADARRR